MERIAACACRKAARMSSRLVEPADGFLRIESQCETGFPSYAGSPAARNRAGKKRAQRAKLNCRLVCLRLLASGMLICVPARNVHGPVQLTVRVTLLAV